MVGFLTQQLHGTNVSANIGEALEARVKDPLWFLARQWQSGEFEAENGGKLTYLAIETAESPLQFATLGSRTVPIDIDAPLEALIEAETADGDAPAWRAEALEYTFSAGTGSHRFIGNDYAGRALDWYSFDVARHAPGPQAVTSTRQMTPTQLYFPGCPHPRWWRFEDGSAYFDEPADPEPNVLSMLLPEFFYTDINNWYVLPLPMAAGCLREVRNVAVVDSFGVVTNLPPADQTTGTWRVFALERAQGASGAALDGRFLLAPNIAIDVLYNDEIEDIRFIRDEDANLVWAVEFRYRAASGATFVNGEPPSPQPTTSDNDGQPRFRLMSDMQRHWIPYVPRRQAPGNAQSGDMYLRRGRTDEAATGTTPQYRSKILAESVRINEEEIPRSGLRVRRIARYARGSDGTQHFWVGRLKESGQRTALPGLRFDYVEGSQ